MKMLEVIDAYVSLQRSRGMRFDAADKMLRQFSRAMGNPDINQAGPGAVAGFIRGVGLPSATWTLRFKVLSGFYRFAISRGHVEESPLPQSLPKLPPQQSPYVYSLDELRRLLNATSALHVEHSRLQAPMYRTLLLLLYGSGLRIGEALALTLHDVNLIERIIVVRDTKSYKTRMVPIGPRLTLELTNYTTLRRQLPMPGGENSAFFTTRTGRGWPYQHVITLFQRVRAAAEINCPAGELRPPRLHDLRHTAAVHRVIAWYRSGKDVQRLLPQLATWLGHIDIKSTQRYLRMTPELMQVASQRFASYSRWGAGDE
jgi:integrase/recombinase XerD